MMPNPFNPSQAMTDVGMGTDLQQQVQSQILERRKRALLGANPQPAQFGALGLGSGQTGQGNTGGMALQAVMGTGVALGG